MTVKRRIEKLEQATSADKTKHYVIVGKNGKKIILPSNEDKSIRVNIDLDQI